MRALHGHIFEKRIGDSGFGSFGGAFVALGFARAHHRFTHLIHHRFNIGKVEIDKTRLDHQIGNARNARMQHFISHSESLGKCCLGIGNAEQILVRNDNQRIDFGSQFFNTGNGGAHAATPFKVKRLGDDTDRQNALLARGAGNYRRSARARATAHTGGHKGHMRALQHIDNFRHGFFCGGFTDGRVSTGAQTFCQFGTDLNPPVGR